MRRGGSGDSSGGALALVSGKCGGVGVVALDSLATHTLRCLQPAEQAEVLLSRRTEPRLA